MPPDKQKVLKSLEHEVAAGGIVFSEGEETRDLYILLSGQVEIQKRGRTIAAITEPDTYLGEMSTLLGTPRTATLRAKTACRFIRVPENKVSDFFAHSPALAIKLAKTLAQRLEQMNIKYERFLKETQEDAEEAEKTFGRLTASAHCRRLLALYREKAGQEVSVKDMVMEMNIPMSEVNKVFLEFSECGLIRIEDRTLEFLEPANKALRQKIRDWIPA